MIEVDRGDVATVPYEVGVMRRWVEESVLGNGFCPPLNMLARDSRNADGSLNWDRMARQVDIVSLYDMDLADQGFQGRVNDTYFQFIRESITQPETPVVRFVVLPDFKANDDLGWTAEKARDAARGKLETTPDGRQLVRQLVDQYPDVGKNSRPRTYYQDAAELTVDGMFWPMLFFGQQVEDGDIKPEMLMPKPVSRQRVLARAPHYALQLVHMGKSMQAAETFNIDKLRERNTKRATKVETVYEAQMHQLRHGRA